MTKELSPLHKPVSTLGGVGPSTASALARLGIETVQDLLEYLPYRLEDRSQLVIIAQLRAGENCVIHGTLQSVSTRKSKRNMLIIQASLVDDSGKINAVWFNQRYLLRLLQPGNNYYLYGCKKIIPTMGNPFIVSAIIDQPAIVPFYHATKGLGQGMFARLFRQVQPQFKLLPAVLPSAYTKSFPAKAELLRLVHTQPNPSNLASAKELLAYEELTVLALAISIYQKPAKKVTPLPIDIAMLKKMVAELPFSLTTGQRKAAWEVITDLARPKTMRRLLYGEVGSGKTVVAALAAATVASSGAQVIVLCPTTTLASQQFQVFSTICQATNLRCALVMGDHKSHNYGAANILIGTHALLQKQAKTKNVGLVIIDEQHRFGVKDRQHLLTLFPDAHLLMMTATPIPRSLAQTIFGSVDITYLLEKPKQQQPVETYVFTDKNRLKVQAEIAKRLHRNEPGYIICPLIQASSNTDSLFAAERKTVESEAKRVTKLFPHATVGVLHGRLSEDQKQHMLDRFRAGGVQILVSTTVVEVGIDNPNATWMLIEEADMFGLNQLHQLRGRIGRGSKASVCFMHNSATSEFGAKRLEVITKTDNGLELAEYDLTMRGPGEIIGYEQSGLPQLRHASWQDVSKIKAAFTTAQKILDDGLQKYPELYRRVSALSNDPTFG